MYAVFVSSSTFPELYIKHSAWSLKLFLKCLKQRGVIGPYWLLYLIGSIWIKDVTCLRIRNLWIYFREISTGGENFVSIVDTRPSVYFWGFWIRHFSTKINQLHVKLRSQNTKSTSNIKKHVNSSFTTCGEDVCFKRCSRVLFSLKYLYNDFFAFSFETFWKSNLRWIFPAFENSRKMHVEICREYVSAISIHPLD